MGSLHVETDALTALGVKQTQNTKQRVTETQTLGTPDLKANPEILCREGGIQKNGPACPQKTLQGAKDIFWLFSTTGNGPRFSPHIIKH